MVNLILIIDQIDFDTKSKPVKEFSLQAPAIAIPVFKLLEYGFEIEFEDYTISCATKSFQEMVLRFTNSRWLGLEISTAHA